MYIYIYIHIEFAQFGGGSSSEVRGAEGPSFSTSHDLLGDANIMRSALSLCGYSGVVGFPFTL